MSEEVPAEMRPGVHVTLGCVGSLTDDAAVEVYVHQDGTVERGELGAVMTAGVKALVGALAAGWPEHSPARSLLALEVARALIGKDAPVPQTSVVQ